MRIEYTINHLNAKVGDRLVCQDEKFIVAKVFNKGRFKVDEMIVIPFNEKIPQWRYRILKLWIRSLVAIGYIN